MRALVVPPAAQRDEGAIQMLSAWVAEQGLHCTMNVGMRHAQGRNEPAAWGILLADVVRHLANAIQTERGTSAEVTIDEIAESLREELSRPTSKAVGEFHPGHS